MQPADASLGSDRDPILDLPPSRTARRAEGRSARARVPRARLADWDPAARGHDALEPIVAQGDMRVADLLPLRYSRMAESPWTYYRGAAAVMAADLATSPHTALEVQLCGDAHVLNFGLWATPERQLSFDLRDFDETLRGPFEWDVKRFAASLVVLARDNGLPAAVGEQAVARAMRAYRERMAGYVHAKQLDIWYDLITVDDLLSLFKPAEQERISARVARQSTRRTSRGAFDKLTVTVDGRRRIVEDPPKRVRVDDSAVEHLVEDVLAAYRASVRAELRHLLDHFSLVDWVRQVVGVGSVGMRVYLVLLDSRAGDDPLFLQVKQAGPSVYEAALGPSPYANHGERVVTGKRMIQSATDIFAGWTSVGGADFYVRQFRDMKIIPDSESIAPRLVTFARKCGAVLARAHARTGDPVAISAYIGKGGEFDRAMGAFAHAYADQTERDQRQLADAIASRVVPGES